MRPPAEDASSEIRLCDMTGLCLVSSPVEAVWRVARNEYGPVAPRVRDGDDVDDWNRFDLRGYGTLYAASSSAGAYGECLAPLRPALDAMDLSELLDDTPADATPVQDDWARSGFMGVGQIPKQWRVDRCLAQIRVTDGWFVDINDEQTLATIRQQHGRELARHGCRDVDGSVIRSENRRATVAIATWLFRRPLFDGSEPLGIRYASRHSDKWSCWAIWSNEDGAVPAELVHKQPIESTDPSLMRICRLWSLRVF